MFSQNRIDLDDAANLLLWADNLGVSTDRLREVVARVGPMAPSVRFFLDKSATEKKPAARVPVHEPKRDRPHYDAQNASAGAVTPATLFPSMTT